MYHHECASEKCIEAYANKEMGKNSHTPYANILGNTRNLAKRVGKGKIECTLTEGFLQAEYSDRNSHSLNEETKYDSSREFIWRARALKDNETSIGSLKDAVRDFVHKRRWEKYHNPKDLAESICIEAAELLQLFQWTKPEESENIKCNLEKAQRIKEELADVVLYCLSMANSLDFDLSTGILSKIEQNKRKYPAELYQGAARVNRQKGQ